jgi:hypothetical protein
VLARTFEAAGLATVSISMVLEHSAMLKPPRALYVPFPFGLPLGNPGDSAQQRRVLDAAFGLFEDRPPVLRELTGEVDGEVDGKVPGAPVQASALGEGAVRAVGVADEVTQMRHYQERWVARTGRSSVGLTGVPPTRFRGLVRFLEAVAGGDLTSRPRECPPEAELAYFIRWCCDDLKAFYAEARFVMRPEDSGDAVQRWLWGETAVGELIRRVGERMNASDDPLMRQVAYGVAR